MNSQSTQKINKELFESAPIARAVFTMAVPTVITQLINIAYNFADTWFVGRTGDPAMVATLGVCFPIFVIMAAVSNLFGIGGASAISRALGAGNPRRARRVFAFCFWTGLAGAVVYLTVMALFRRQIIGLIGGDENDWQYVSDYIFWTMIIGAVPSVGNVLCGHLVRSIGASREAGFGMSMGGVLNIVLDPLFMFVILPPGQEITGAAIATMLSNTCAFLYFLQLILRRRGHPVLTLDPRDYSAAEGIPMEVVSIGLPAALQTTFAMFSNIMANNLMVPYGSEAVAGMGVAKKLNMIGFNTCMGVTQGVLPLLGYCWGARNYKRMRSLIRFTGTGVFLYGCLCTLILRGFATPLMRAFIDEPLSLSYGTMYLRILAFAAPLASFSYLVGTVFQAAARKGSAFLIAVLRKGVLDVPLMFLLRDTLALGARGVALATPAAEVLSVLIAAGLYLRLARSMRGMGAGQPDAAGDLPVQDGHA